MDLFDFLSDGACKVRREDLYASLTARVSWTRIVDYGNRASIEGKYL